MSHTPAPPFGLNFQHNVTMVAHYDLLRDAKQKPELAVYNGRLFISSQRTNTWFQFITQIFMNVVRKLFYNNSISFDEDHINKAFKEVVAYHSLKARQAGDKEYKAVQAKLKSAEEALQLAKENYAKLSATENTTTKIEQTALVDANVQLSLEVANLQTLVERLLPHLAPIHAAHPELKLDEQLRQLQLDVDLRLPENIAVCCKIVLSLIEQAQAKNTMALTAIDFLYKSIPQEMFSAFDQEKARMEEVPQVSPKGNQTDDKDQPLSTQQEAVLQLQSQLNQLQKAKEELEADIMFNLLYHGGLTDRKGHIFNIDEHGDLNEGLVDPAAFRKVLGYIVASTIRRAEIISNIEQIEKILKPFEGMLAINNMQFPQLQLDSKLRKLGLNLNLTLSHEQLQQIGRMQNMMQGEGAPSHNPFGAEVPPQCATQ